MAELTPELEKILTKWALKKTKKCADILRGNHIKSRTGKLYGSLKDPKIVEVNNKITVKLKLPDYAQYIDGPGKKKWRIKSGRMSKIPNQFLKPLREFGDIIKDIKDKTIEIVLGELKNYKK